MVLGEKDLMKKNEIPPTRAREGLGLPSPRDFPRAWRCAPSALGKSLGEGKPRPSLARVGGIYQTFPQALSLGLGSNCLSSYEDRVKGGR